jgi:hypothetical protein
MAESTLLTDYLGRGLASARPSSLTVAANALALYYATDTTTWSYWNGSGWTNMTMAVNSVTAGAGLSGGTITASGTIALAPVAAGAILANTGTVSAVPSATALSDLFAINTGTIDVATALRSVPIPFAFSGKPLAGQMEHVAQISDALLNIPATLAGTATYVGTNPTATAVFTLSKVHSGTVTTIGTISIATSGTVTLSGSAYTAAAGDTLRLTAPSPQDSTLADVCITVEGKLP